MSPLFRRIPPGFSTIRNLGGWICLRDELNPVELGLALDRFGSGEGVQTLKRDVKTSIHRGIDLCGRPLCLKVYRSRRRGRKAFWNQCRLWRIGVPVPEPFFLWVRSPAAGSGSAVGMEDLFPRPELDRWLSVRLKEPAELRTAFAELGASIRDLHDRGIYLDDLKTCNLFVEGESPLKIRFVDLDGVRFGGPVGMKRRVKNLVQLNRSTPVSAGMGNRRAFWKEYCRGLTPGAMRWLRREVLIRSGKAPVAYVAATGLVEEPWPRAAREWRSGSPAR